MNLIGIGSAGCNIANKLSSMGPYKIFLMDKKKYRKKTLALGPFDTPEEYEEKLPDLGSYFEKISGKTCMILCGGNLVTSCVLRTLQFLQARLSENIEILYIKPALEGLSETKRMHHTMVMGVLQQYARSGLVSRMYIVDNLLVEALAESVSIKKYYDSLNEIICYCYHMKNVFDNSENIISTISRPHSTSKISTFGFLDLESRNENMLFSIDLPRQIEYHYYIESEKLTKDLNFHSEIRDDIRRNTQESITPGYAVYETKDGPNMCLIIKNSTLIQGQKI